MSPEYRNQKLGKIILKTLTDYLFLNKEEIKKMKGIIEKNNYASVKMALNAGYSVEKSDDNYIYVSKTR